MNFKEPRKSLLLHRNTTADTETNHGRGEIEKP